MSIPPAGASGETPRKLNLLVGLFLTACSTLLLQVTWTRVLSVTLWYHFAFLVVSTALLGFGISGILLALSRRLSTCDLRRGLVLSAMGLAATIIVGFALANRIPFAPFSLLNDNRQLIYAPIYILCITLPFVFSGLCAALLFSRLSSQSGRIYFADLLGAGVGCTAIALVMPAVGGSGGLLVSAALAAAGAAAFASGLPRKMIAAVALLLALGSPWAGQLLGLRISQTKTLAGGVPVQQVLESGDNLYTGWNTFSRVDVLPATFGRAILIDGGTAMSRMPRLTRPVEQLGPIDDERSLVLQPGMDQTVLIIGSGGGWEVAAALRNGARKVVAVEVNPLINRLVTVEMAGFIGNLFSHPNVELHTAEARSFIRRQDRRYDVIMASHTISNAATASGALSLAETYVLTREAFSDYLDHLTPRGYMWITRPEDQLPRLTATVGEALRKRGVRTPGDHLLAFAGGQRAPSFYGCLMLSMVPLSTERVGQIAVQLDRWKLRALYLPGRDHGPTIYRNLLFASSNDRLDRVYESHRTRLRPATDDRPFFNQRRRWGAIDARTMTSVFRQNHRGRMALEDQPVGEVTLLVLLIQSSLLALMLILAPLLVKKRAGLQGRGTLRLLLYFFCLGLGFILCEIGAIQRLTLFLGQPVYTFAVVVGSLLVASGIGSLLSTKLADRVDRIPGRLRLMLCATGLVILLFALLSPSLLETCLGLPFALRVVIAAVILIPLGLCMGMAFPLGIRLAGAVLPSIIPWAWGLNAVASVVGSVAAMVLATLVGFSGVFIIAAAIYALAMLSTLAWRGQQGNAADPASRTP